MTSQPQVRAVRRSPSAVELDLFVPASLDFFPDHFPRQGLLPGVVQLDWAITLGRAHLALEGEFRGVRALKFVNPILPDTALTLVLAQPAPGELAFSYRAEARTLSSGRVLFGAGVAAGSPA